MVIWHWLGGPWLLLHAGDFPSCHSVWLAVAVVFFLCPGWAVAAVSGYKVGISTKASALPDAPVLPATPPCTQLTLHKYLRSNQSAGPAAQCQHNLPGDPSLFCY